MFINKYYFHFYLYSCIIIFIFFLLNLKNKKKIETFITRKEGYPSKIEKK